MAYVILQRKKATKGAKWQVASNVLKDTEHSAAQLQKNIEKANPQMETARHWVEI